MKRAFFLVVAALIVLASLPSTHTLADTSKLVLKKTPHMVIQGETGTVPPGSGGQDNGDADDIAGIKSPAGSVKRGFGGSSQGATIRIVLNMWWNWMVMIR